MSEPPPTPRSSEARLRAVLDSARDFAILEMDASGTVIDQSEGAERILGYAQGELVGRSADVIFTPEDRAAGVPEQERRTAAASGRAVDERWHVRKDGSRFWGSGFLYASDSGDAHTPAFIKVFQDRTREFLASQALADSEARLAHERNRIAELFERAPAYIAVLKGPEHVFELANAAYRRLFPGRELVGRRVRDALPEVQAQGFLEILDAVYRSGEPFVGTESPVDLPGDGRVERLYFDFVYQPVREQDGSVGGIFGLGIDVTRQVLARLTLEEHVRRRTADLVEANKEMEGFTYSVSHDLRAPLRSIASTSAILLQDYGELLPTDALELLERQALAANKMARLMDDLLRLSRIARQELKKADVDLTEMARQVAAERAAEAEVRIQEGLCAEADPTLLRLALENLIGNALKFAKAGERARVTVGRTPEGAFYVRDDGIGFDMRYAPKLFLPFERLVTDREYEGTGIGLANVQRIVHRHGGQVWAESEGPGKGATFYFTLGP